MSVGTYTYQIAIVNPSTVQVRKINRNGMGAGSPSGTFGYTGVRKERIQVLVARAKVQTITSAEIQQLGELLFEALFDDSLRVDFLTLYNELRADPDTVLRVELGVDESTLLDVAALPWEFLCTPPNRISGHFWLATDPNVVFSRSRDLWPSARPITLAPLERLRIVFVVSSPTDRGVVSYDKVWLGLKDLAAESDRIELLPLVNPATKDSIDALLETYKPHIFHFVGHGEFSDEDGRDVGRIALTLASGQTDWVDATRFSTLFGRHQPGVVLLQACEGGQLSASDAFAAVAPQIVRQDIPVVVAMQYEVSNSVARKFALEFYRRLAQLMPVDQAMQEGRQRISDFNRNRHFATPVLFMRVENGHLFTVENGDLVEARSPTEPTRIEKASSSPLPDSERRELRQKLDKYFSTSELQNFCFDLGIDHERFPQNQGKAPFIRELVAYLERTDFLNQFITLCRAERDHVAWPRVADISLVGPSDEPPVSKLTPHHLPGILTPSVDVIPISLHEALSRREVVVFAGGALSQMAGLPSMADVLRPLVASTTSPLPPAEYLSSDHLLDAAESVELDTNRHGIVRHVLDAYQMVGIQPTQAHRLLVRLPVHAFFTTNYDNLLELAFQAEGIACTSLVRDSNLPYAGQNKPYIARLRGDVAQPDTLVLTRNDINTYQQEHPLLVNELQALLVRSTFLFVGYDMIDPGFNLVHDQMGHQLGRDARLSYSVMMDLPVPEQQKLRRRHIQVISLSPAEGQSNHDRLAEWLAALLRGE